MTSPRMIGRPVIPDGYGVTDGGEYLSWPDVREQLRQAINYWVATTRPDRRPHVAPRWGIWMDDRFWYDGSPETRHAKNLRVNSAAVLHLESGASVTIVEGSSVASEPVDVVLGHRISAEFRRKYGPLGYAPDPGAWSGEDAGGMLIFKPAIVLSWTEFPRDATRFLFDP